MNRLCKSLLFSKRRSLSKDFSSRPAKVARKRFGHADARIRAHEPLGKLDTRHFQRKNSADLIFHERGVLDDIHADRRFTDARGGLPER